MMDWSRHEGGSSQPQLFLAQDPGTGSEIPCVAKLPNNPVGPRILVNEWVCSGLLDVLHLPHPRSFLIEVSADALPSSGVRYKDGTPLEPGLGFAGEYLDPSLLIIPGTEFGTPERLARIENSEALCGLAVFDTWTGNTDKRQLRAIASTPGSDRLRAYAVDQGACFGGHKWTAHSLERARGPKFSPQLWQCLNGLPDVRQLLTECLTALRRISRGTLEQIVDTIPPDWGTSDAERAALVSFLLQRIEPTESLLTAACLSWYPRWTWAESPGAED